MFSYKICNALSYNTWKPNDCGYGFCLLLIESNKTTKLSVLHYIEFDNRRFSLIPVVQMLDSMSPVTDFPVLVHF